MIIESIIVVGFAISIDLLFGDPKNKFHPTAWIGIIIAKFTLLAKHENPLVEKLGGIFIIVATSCVVIFSLLLFDLGISLISIDYLSLIVFIIASGLLLKSTLAIRGMEQHALAVLRSISQDNLDMARSNLSMIVKRDTKNLDRNHILSGVLESLSENIVDGITSPIFYYAFFGLYGAFIYRVVNTADSMIGYKNKIFRNLGWFTAFCDTILNYIPSRLTGLVLVLSALIMRKNWKESYSIMSRDGSNTESPNAGYPMAALAGALEITFEKIDHYKLGDGNTMLNENHVFSAIKMMKLSCILFFGIVVIPIIFILSSIGWWFYA